jgi:CP family cyanate transporter-like MFS transporter
VALFIAAANLRPAIAAVSPLVDTIRGDLGLSSVGVAFLTTLPTLAMGVCAPLAATVGRRYGLHRGVLVGLVIIAVATAARIGGQSMWLQLSCATLAGAGIAAAQTLLPSVVRTRFASRATLVTGLYTAGLGLGAVVAVGVSVPLTDAFDSWPAALACWAILAVVGIVLWISGTGALDLGGAAGPAGPATSGLPWREPLAWRITAISAGNSALYYCELAWFAPLLHDDGHRSLAGAGDLATVMFVVQVIAMLVVPAVLGEKLDRRVGLALTSLMLAGGFFGFAFSPDSGTWAWIILMGIGHGGLFPLVLALPATLSRDGAHASRLSGMAFFISYACAAAAPLIVGWLRDSIGDFDLAFALLGAAAALIVVPVAQLSPQRLDRARRSQP